MRGSIIVLHAEDMRKASRIAAERPSAWLYLGQDIKQHVDISRTLGKENRYFIGDLLQKVAHQQKQPFIDFIAELGLHQKNKLHWWASYTAYKDPFASDFFLLWCYAEVFEKVCLEQEWDNNKSLLVLIQDRWLYRYLWQRHKENLAFRFPSRKSTAPEALKLVARGIATRGYLLLMATIQRRRLEQAAREKAAPLMGNQTKCCYIFSEIGEKSFADGHRYEDANFGRLKDILNASGIQVRRLTPFFIPKTSIADASSSGEFVFLGKYLSLKDMASSTLPVFRIHIPPKLIHNPIRTLLRREAIYEFANARLPQFLLHYRAFKDCLSRLSQNSKEMCIIYPFENQPWEKMLCLAAKELDERIKLVGYQHSTVPLLLLSYFPGAGEASDTPLPDYIVTNGEHTLNLLKNAGYGQAQIVNGGALRYEYLHNNSGNTIIDVLVESDKTHKTVLIALSYSRVLAAELLLAVFSAFADPQEVEARFLIKPHPWVPLENLGIPLPPMPAHFQRTDKPMSELLRETHVVLYSSSTVGLEALLADVPVIRYHSEHLLDLDPLDGFEGSGIESCSEDNLKQAVLSALNRGKNGGARGSASGASILNSVFSPVDENVWRQIVSS